MSEQHQEMLCQQVKAFLERQHLTFKESEEPNALGKPKRFDIQHGKYKCVVKVFLTGAIQVQGAESQLRISLLQMKEALENTNVALGTPLPFEIESFPERLIAMGADSIIVKYIEDSIVCLKHDSVLAGAFLLGAASEKAMWLLISAYTEAIADSTHKGNFEKRTNKRFISVAYEEYKQSFASSKSKPTDPELSNEVDQQVDDLFDFYRRCRNKVGHPEIPPRLNKGAVLANMGQFVTYLEVLMKLTDYFKNNPVTL